MIVLVLIFVPSKQCKKTAVVAKWLMWFTPILKLADPGSNPARDVYMEKRLYGRFN